MFSSSSAALVGFALSLLFATAVSAKFASIQFSTVAQCGNFTVTFEGGKAPDALPLTLSVLPVNGTPVFIALPDDAWNATSQTGAAITFLPFAEGTQFVASLDDSDGVGTALVSDVLVIDKSATDDVSCLPSAATISAPQYTVADTLSQCESFSVHYNPAVSPGSPTVRAFVPQGESFPVNSTGANSTSGVDTYLMDVPRNSQVVLLFSDQSGHRETSAILPVLGDNESDTSCIPTDPLSTAATLSESSDSSDTTRVAPKITVIIIVACVGVVLLVAGAMLAWYFLHRRKAQRARKFAKLEEVRSRSPRDPEKQLVLPQKYAAATSPTSPDDAPMQQFARNPPYIRGSLLVTPTSPDPNDPFGERAVGSILGTLSARESLSTRYGLGATAMGNNANGSSVLALPRSRYGSPPPQASPAMRSSVLRRSSLYDGATEPIPGTSPYWGGRMAITPDNSLASTSILSRARVAPPARRQSISSASVSSVEIDRILEMATIYGGADMVPDLPQPVVTAPATLRSSAYMAGRESRRQSYASPLSSPAHSRNNSMSSPPLSQSANHSTLRMQRAFRSPPLATLPSSPLPSPGIRPSLDIDRATAVAVPAPAQMPSALSRTISPANRQSVWSEDGDELEGFTMLRPPPRR